MEGSICLKNAYKMSVTDARREYQIFQTGYKHISNIQHMPDECIKNEHHKCIQNEHHKCIQNEHHKRKKRIANLSNIYSGWNMVYRSHLRSKLTVPLIYTQPNRAVLQQDGHHRLFPGSLNFQYSGSWYHLTPLYHQRGRQCFQSGYGLWVWAGSQLGFGPIYWVEFDGPTHWAGLGWWIGFNPFSIRVGRFRRRRKLEFSQALVNLDSQP